MIESLNDNPIIKEIKFYSKCVIIIIILFFVLLLFIIILLLVIYSKVSNLSNL
jgi:hypothetical protein